MRASTGHSSEASFLVYKIEAVYTTLLGLLYGSREGSHWRKAVCHECLVYFRSQHPGKPFPGKEDPDSDLSGDPDSNPEAHLPSICLKQVFPKYAKQFNYLRLVDRMANLFIRFLGIKGTMKLGPTGFRTFIRLVRPAFSCWRFGEGRTQSLT